MRAPEVVKNRKNFNYSLEEIKTGEKWKNGKPIYRKIIESHYHVATGSTFTETLFAHNIDNFDTAINWRAFFSDESHYLLPFVSTKGGMTAITSIDKKNIGIRCYNDNWDRDITFIIEYTKTTD